MKNNLNVDTQGLREKILDLAMRGKLVEQDAGDEPASALLEKIKAEKAELVKEGKIKKSKKLPEITDDEKPFDIPDSWEWVRLGDAALKIIDGTHHSPVNDISGEYMYITAKNIKKSGLDLSNITYVSEKVHKEIYSRCNPEYGDILYIKDGATTGIATINTIKEPFSMLSSVALIKTSEEIFNPFLSFAMNSPYFYKMVRDGLTGTGITRVTLTKLNNYLFPLPPLAEQHRIADKVSELFSQIDVIEKNVAEYQGLEQAMRSKLLDLAMRGKLVEQDPNDEPASELLKQIQSEKAQLVKEGKIKKGKKLPEITDDEKPFDIPDSWKWVRLGDIGDWGAGATPLKSNHEYYENGTIPWILTGDLNDGHISSANQFITEKALNETSVKIKPVGSVLIAMYGATIGKLGILDIEATTNQACCACVTFSGISKMYLFDYLMFMKPKFIESGVGGAQPNISRTKIVATPIPLPPLEEQKRIVAKLEELFEQLDIINNNLVSAS